MPPSLFTRIDETPDELFYATARFVTHLDDAAIAAVTQLYRECFPAGGAILDLMSSWISHLPPEVTYRRVIGLGMNGEELGANPRLHGFVVQNLNETPRLPWGDGEFDGAAICVSVDYLTRPVEVLRECGRVLRAGAPLVITFSNRCFPTKVTAAWRMLDDQGHQELVARYFAEAGNWTVIEIFDRSPRRTADRRDGEAPPFASGESGGDPLYAVIARSAGRA
jgi:SAM-dependent methyltransferase